MRGWFGGAVLMLVLVCQSACGVDRQSDVLACGGDQDCDPGRVCVDGFCLPEDAVDIDADVDPAADASTVDGSPGVDAPPGALALIVDPTSLSLVEGDTTGTLDVSLTVAPGGSFSVTLTSDDEGAATVSPAMLTFDDGTFGTPQAATVTPVEDGNSADESLTVTVSGPAVSDVLVSVTVTDQD